MYSNLVFLDKDENGENDSLFVFFKLDEKTYAIPASNTLEVLKLPMLERPERMSSGIIGFLNYNNLTINALDLRSIFNIESKPFSVENELIILKTEEMMFAIVVDSVLDILPISLDNIQHSPYSSSENFVKMLYMFNNEMISIIDLYTLEEFIKNNQFSVDEKEYHKLLPMDDKSQNILKERSKALITKAGHNIISNIFNQDQFLLFNLNENNYCIHVKYIKEFVSAKNIEITRLPFTPSYVEGIINLRGDFYTIISLKSFLNLDEYNSINNCEIIILDAKDNNIAVLVDKIQSISDLDSDKFVHKSTGKSDSKYVMSEFIEDEKIFNILNIEKFLNDEKLFINIE